MKLLVIFKALFVSTLLMAPAAQAAPQGSWSDQFDQPGLLGRVFALGEYQGELIAGGLGLQADGEPSFGLTARFDGTTWHKMGSGISSSSSQVRAFEEYGGLLIAGGEFCCAGSVSVQSIAGWDGVQWQPLGSGIAGIVYALEVFNGDLYAAGQFSEAGGVPVMNIARWDGAQWHDVAGGLDKSFDPEVLELQVGPDGKLYASGEFDTAGGASAFNVARYDGATWSAIGAGLPGPLNGLVWDLEWYQTELYAASNFDMIGGTGSSLEKVVKWNGASWVGVGDFPDSSIGTNVTSLTVLGSKLYAGGSIVQAGGANAERIAAYDGTSWSFIGGVGGSGSTSSIWAQSVHNGALIVGGEFSRAGQAPATGPAIVSHSIARYDGANWSSVGAGAGFNNSVKGAVLWNGQVVAVGPFSEAGSQVVSGPVIFDGQDWSQLATFGGGLAKCLTVWNGDLIVGGEFTTVNGQALGYVVRYDGTQWTGFPGPVSAETLEVYQGQLYAGGLGGVKRFNGTTWETFATQLFGFVNDLHEHQGVLYIGGSMFGSANISSWNGTIQQTVGGGTNGSVTCMESFEGDLVLGGEFTTAGGVPANRLARWNGSAFSDFGGVTGTNVDSIAVYQGKVHASGNLIVPGLPANKYIARWEGGSWQALAGGFTPGGQASTLVADDQGGHLYAGGLISQADGKPSRYFARWDTPPVMVGTPFCFGDGTGLICPCGNIGSMNGHGCANSAFGAGAQLTALGFASLSSDDLELFATSSVPGAAGVFFQGTLQQNAGFGSILGDGLLCAGGQIERLRIVFANAQGAVSSGTGLAVEGAATAGVELHYQWWYRDPVGSPCSTDFNLSNGLSITWGF